MKVCPKCNTQYPDEYNACPICGIDLVDVQGQSNVNMGNANAISGGVHSADDHSLHDSNNQTNSNNTSNSYNTTNNTTIYEAETSESEKLQKNLLAYRMKCKNLFEDGLLSSNAESQLRELQVALCLADELVVPIKEEVRLQSKKRKKQLSLLGRQDISQTKTIIEQNTTSALLRQLEKLEALMLEYDDDSLKFVYYQMSSMLEPVRYTNRYEDSGKGEYWETYWAYIAYMLQNRTKQANEALVALGRWHTYYPEQNDVILYIVGQLMQDEPIESIQPLRSKLPAHYSADLQLLLDAIDELLQIDYEKEYMNIRPVHAFYIKTLFTEFLNTQKANGQQRLEEISKRKAQEIQEEKDRIHKQELAKQATAQAKAEADAEAARLAQAQQEAENIAKAQELANQQREAEEAAAAAAQVKAEAEKAEAERIAAEQKAAEEEAKRIRREKIIAWLERKLLYILGVVTAITFVVFLSVWIPMAKSKKEKRERQQEKYDFLSERFAEQLQSITFDRALNAVSAYNTLCQMRDIEIGNSDVKSTNHISYSEGKNSLVAKTDSLLVILEIAKNDIYCDAQEKIDIQNKISQLKIIKNDLK